MILTIKKKSIIFILVFALIIAGVCIFYARQDYALASISTNKKVPIYSVDREDRKIAITFDAAWRSDKTTGILEILKKEDVKATFFLVDFWIKDNEELVKKISEQNIEIGNHSVTHLDMTKLSKKDRKSEISTVNNKIKELTNKDVKFFRFPFGAYDKESIKSVEEEGLIPIQWDVDSLDWKGLNKDQILARIKEGVKPGSIILFHNNSDHILDALEDVIKYLKSENFEMVGMSELVYLDNYYIDINGIQHNNSI